MKYGQSKCIYAISNVKENDEFDTKKLKNIKDMFEDYQIDMDDIYSYLQLIGCETVDEKDLKFNFDL